MNSCVSTLCPVVICTYLCTSEGGVASLPSNILCGSLPWGGLVLCPGSRGNVGSPPTPTYRWGQSDNSFSIVLNPTRESATLWPGRDRCKPSFLSKTPQICIEGRVNPRMPRNPSSREARSSSNGLVLEKESGPNIIRDSPVRKLDNMRSEVALYYILLDYTMLYD